MSCFFYHQTLDYIGIKTFVCTLSLNFSLLVYLTVCYWFLKVLLNFFAFVSHISFLSCVPEEYIFCDFSRAISPSVIGFHMGQVLVTCAKQEDLCSLSALIRAGLMMWVGAAQTPFTRIETTTPHNLLAKLRISLRNMTALRSTLGFPKLVYRT